uniref:MOB kinase activator-like 2 n=1 Tax=Strigamia maritima TaxID=126957 RepID=T1IJY4_STRMM
MGKARKKEKDSPQSAPDEQKLYLENTMLEQCFSDVDFRLLVEQPSGLEYNEWLASHIDRALAFFEHINLIYGTISEFCTMSGCPDMTGPCSRQYLWFDERGKKCKVAAPHYIDYVMTFTQKTINDETIFPTKYANDFPTSIESLVKKIHQLLFHVVAHMYHAHFKELVLLSLHAHLNLVFAHLVLFNERYRLIEEKETDVLHDLAIGLKLLGATDSGDASASQERGGGSSVTSGVAESGDNNCEKTNDSDCSGNISTNIDTQPAFSLYLDGGVEVQ